MKQFTTIPNDMKPKLNVTELAIFLSAILLIFFSEYTYIFLHDRLRAIFIGLWAPTILLVLIYFNLKLKR